MARPEKEATVAEIKDRLQRATSVVLADYRGLNVSEATELRRKLREAGVEFKVVKNSLTTLAARAALIVGIEPYLTGPTALAFGYADPVAPARLLADFARSHKNLSLKAGVLEGRAIDQAGVKTLAELPSRERMLALVAGMFQAPMRGLATVLLGPIRNLVYGLEALRKQREEAA